MKRARRTDPSLARGVWNAPFTVLGMPVYIAIDDVGDCVVWRVVNYGQDPVAVADECEGLLDRHSPAEVATLHRLRATRAPHTLHLIN